MNIFLNIMFVAVGAIAGTIIGFIIGKIYKHFRPKPDDDDYEY